ERRRECAAGEVHGWETEALGDLGGEGVEHAGDQHRAGVPRETKLLARRGGHGRFRGLGDGIRRSVWLIYRGPRKRRIYPSATDGTSFRRGRAGGPAGGEKFLANPLTESGSPLQSGM